MTNVKIRTSLLSALSLTLACSSMPNTVEFPITADPNQEMTRVDEAINKARSEQVNILSPRNFESATKAMDDAKEARNKNKDQKTVLHQIAIAQAHLNEAKSVANVAGQLIPGVIKERGDALKAQAPQYFSKDFESADADLKGVTMDIETNDTKSAETYRKDLEARYSDLELQSIRKVNIGDARNNMEQAVKEGAQKLTPLTLSWADKKVNEDDAVVVANRHDAASVGKASSDSIAASTRLLRMVRQAKSSSAQTPEQLASQIEVDKSAVATSENKLEKTNTELNEQKTDVAILAADNVKLEGKDQLEKQYEYARGQFTKDEAEVYKQGDKLLLRLKGLSFPKDQSIIRSENYPLLTKVQKVIRETAPGKIAIEGHTDSRGTNAVNNKLSAARAEAVENYLKANDTMKADNISALGFGDSRPIASNKTKIGRAQNRRVDVILNSTAVQ